MEPHVSDEKNAHTLATLLKEKLSAGDEDRPGRPTELKSTEVINQSMTLFSLTESQKGDSE